MDLRRMQGGGAVLARFVWLVLACAVIARALWVGHVTLASRWPESRSGERVVVEAIVTDIPARDALGWSFDADLVSLRPDAGQRLRARLAWAASSPRPHAGERWRLLVSLRAPRGAVNPAGVDAEMQLFRDRVHAVGAVVASSPINQRLDAGHRPLAALRERIAERLRASVTDRDAAALVAALAVGATDQMTLDQWRVFNATGTTHLVAISGSHVTLFAVGALALARLLWTHALWRVLPMTREPFAALFGLSASTAYALLAGFSVPTQRTLVMLAAWLYARSTSRACGPLTPFAIALLAVLGLDPFAPLSAGFWLSFVAMAAIVAVAHPPIARRGWLVEAVTVQLAVFVALAPLTIAWFGSLSLAGLVVNAAAIPAIGWIFVPLVLASLALSACADALTDGLLRLASFLYERGWPWLEAAANAPFALLQVAPATAWYVAAIVAAAVALLPWPMRLRLASALWLLPLASAGSTAPGPGAVDVTFLDVGQATAVVIRTSAHVVLFGLGDRFGSSGATVDRVIVPLLRKFRLSHVDAVVLDGGGRGDSMGLTALMAAMKVDRAVLGNGAAGDFDGASSCASPLAWQWDGVGFRTMQPEGSSACALRISAGGRSILLPGNVDARAERRLVAAGFAPADVVLVPRQASAAASSASFVTAATAERAIVSGRRTGSRTQQAVIARWEASGAAVSFTSDRGAMQLRVAPDGELSPIVAWRAVRRAPWRFPASGP